MTKTFDKDQCLFTLLHKVLLKMSEKESYLSDISEIKNMMERSSRFISLSGLSGIFAGIYALIGAWLVFNRMYEPTGLDYSRIYNNAYSNDILFMIAVALGVLILALATGIYFTTKKAKSKNLKVWDKTTQRLIINLFIPLFAGGVICLILIDRTYFVMVAPTMLVFYGLSLINASHFTYRDIRYLGLTELALGLLSFYYIGHGLLFWSVGFGLLHIIYGALMYFKYEK